MEKNKNIYEQLDEIHNDIKSIKDENIEENNIDYEKVIKDGKRIFKYQGDKSELKRRNQSVKKMGITNIVISVIQLILICIGIYLSKIPLLWLSLIVFVPILALEIYVFSIKIKPTPYEEAYEDFVKEVGRFNKISYDDNNIICESDGKWWRKPLNFCWLLFFGFSMALTSIGIFNEVSFVIYIISFLLFCSTMMKIFCSNYDTRPYDLYFCYDKYKIPYHKIKEYIKQHN